MSATTVEAWNSGCVLLSACLLVVALCAVAVIRGLR